MRSNPIIDFKMLLFVLVTLGIFVTTSKAIAGGFDTFSDQQRLENQMIIATGNIGKQTTFTDTSNLNIQKQTVFEIGRFCFKSSDSFEDISGKAGLLLLDQFSSASIGLITESISSIKIKLIRVTVLDCASLALQESKRLQSQFLQQMEILKQQKAALDQMLKDQRSTTKKTP